MPSQWIDGHHNFLRSCRTKLPQILILRNKLLLIDTRNFTDFNKEVSSILPPIPRRDIEVPGVIVNTTLNQTRRSHRDQLSLPSIRINNYM